MDTVFFIGPEKPVEYFCFHCRQLRLSPYAVPERCGNCSSKDIKIGPVNSLDKDALIRKVEGFTE